MIDIPNASRPALDAFEMHEAMIRKDEFERHFPKWPVISSQHTIDYTNTSVRSLPQKRFIRRSKADVPQVNTEFVQKDLLNNIKRKSEILKVDFASVSSSPEIKHINLENTNEIQNQPIHPSANQLFNGLLMNKILQRAEKLLENVQSSTNPHKIRQKNRYEIKSSTSPTDILTKNITERKKIVQNSETAQIDWLLHDLPEAFETEHEYNDEEIENIIKQGGTPPSQLQLPSIYAINQQLMSKLTTIKFILINLNHFLCYSCRFGVRRHGSFLIIRVPTQFPNEKMHNTNGIVVPLDELELPESTFGQITKKFDRKDVLRNYFVGGINLHKSIIVPMKLDDQILRSWTERSDDPMNRIEIELYSFLKEPSVYRKYQRYGVKELPTTMDVTEPATCFAKGTIPMIGLLGTQDLDMTMNMMLRTDLETHATVTSRMNSIPFGKSTLPKRPETGATGLNGASDASMLGTITARVTLCDEDPRDIHDVVKTFDTVYLKTDRNVESIAANMPIPHQRDDIDVPFANGKAIVVFRNILPNKHEPAAITTPSLQSVSSTASLHNNLNKIESKDKIHSALNFVPEEKKPWPDVTTGNQNDLSKNFFGFAILGVEGLSIPSDIFIKITNLGPQKIDPRIVITSKLSQRSRETIVKPIASLFSTGATIPTLDAEINVIKINEDIPKAFPKSPLILEIWLEWSHESSQKKCLLGLCKHYTTNDTSPLTALHGLEITDIATKRVIGQLWISSLLNHDRMKVESYLLSTINSYFLKAQEKAARRISINNVVIQLPDNQIQLKESTEAKGVDPPMVAEGKSGPSLHAVTTDEQDDSILPIQRPPLAVTPRTMHETMNPILDDINLLDSIQISNESSVSTDSLERNFADDVNKFLTNELHNSLDSLDEILGILNKSHLKSDPSHSFQREEDVNMKLSFDTKNRTMESEVQIEIDEQIIENNLKGLTESTHDRTLVHILDFSIEGFCPFLNLQPVAYSTDLVLGCFICYDLPGLHADQQKFLNEEINSLLPYYGYNESSKVELGNKKGDEFVLWWDAESVVLNSTNRHRFIFNKDASLIINQENRTEFSNITRKLQKVLLSDKVKQSIRFNVILSDENGNLPSIGFHRSNAVIGSGELLMNDISSLIHQGGGSIVVPINITWKSGCTATINREFSTLPLIVSHRIEPILLNKESRFENTIKIDDSPAEQAAHLETVSEKVDFKATNDMMKDNGYDTGLDLKSTYESMPTQRMKSRKDHLHNTDGSVPIDTPMPMQGNTFNQLIVKLENISNLSFHSVKSYDYVFVSLSYHPSSSLTQRSERVDQFSSLKKSATYLHFDESFSIDVNHRSMRFSNELKLNDFSTANHVSVDDVIIMDIYGRNDFYHVSLRSHPIGWTESSTVDMIRITDEKIGRVIVDLKPLKSGLNSINGWYHIVDTIQNIVGQMKIVINFEIYEPPALPEVVETTPMKIESEPVIPPTSPIHSVSQYALEKYEGKSLSDLKSFVQELEHMNNRLLHFNVPRLEDLPELPEMMNDDYTTVDHVTVTPSRLGAAHNNELELFDSNDKSFEENQDIEPVSVSFSPLRRVIDTVDETKIPELEVDSDSVLIEKINALPDEESDSEKECEDDIVLQNDNEEEERIPLHDDECFKMLAEPISMNGFDPELEGVSVSMIEFQQLSDDTVKNNEDIDSFELRTSRSNHLHPSNHETETKQDYELVEDENILPNEVMKHEYCQDSVPFNHMERVNQETQTTENETETRLSIGSDASLPVEVRNVVVHVDHPDDITKQSYFIEDDVDADVVVRVSVNDSKGLHSKMEVVEVVPSIPLEKPTMKIELNEKFFSRLMEDEDEREVADCNGHDRYDRVKEKRPVKEVVDGQVDTRHNNNNNNNNSLGLEKIRTSLTKTFQDLEVVDATAKDPSRVSDGKQHTSTNTYMKASEFIKQSQKNCHTSTFSKQFPSKSIPMKTFQFIQNHPGMQKQFIDYETERISNIMFNVLNKK